MFAKQLIKKATNHHLNHHHPQKNTNGLTSTDLDFRINVHYGIPSTASILAFDPIQRLLAIGTLDGRIKVIGGDNIEGLLISPKQFPYKYLEFLQNQGFLVSISNDNDIEVWNLESRCIACSFQWESNITAFSVICGSTFMYIGDEYGLMSVLKYEADDGELLQLPYHISSNSLTEAAGGSFANHQTIVGVLPQPCSSGNRVLIAYESGLIILWDIVEARIVTVRGDKALQLKDGVVSSNEAYPSLSDDTSECDSEGKEISALCWASSTGSVLAVGYIDGDILFWKTSTDPSNKGKQAGSSHNNVVKLQLSSAERRLPVIVLHWCTNNKSHHDGDGKLFIYGGDEIGSEEVLTVLTLAWSPGMESLDCVGRVDLTLTGSFADLILLETAGAPRSDHNDALFVLTNPGQLQIFENASLSASISQQEKKTSVSSVEFPVVIPTINPFMTVAELFCLPTGRDSSKALSEIASFKKLGSTPNLFGGTKWPLTGGVSNHLSFTEDNRIERVYVAGYQDGSIRIWDSTYPVLSLLFVLEGKVKGIDLSASSASISKVDFCFLNLNLAVGNECGLVRLYDLNGSLNETTFHVVTDSKHEVHHLPQAQGPSCKAVFSFLNSTVQTLEFANYGAKLLVGYECGRVAVLEMSSLSALFLTDCISSPSSPVISMTWKAFMHSNGQINNPKHSGSKNPDNHAQELMFILTKNAKVYVMDAITGNLFSSRPMQLKESAAISMYVIEGNITGSGLVDEKQPQHSSTDTVIRNEHPHVTAASGDNQHETEHHSSSENIHSLESIRDSLFLLCCKDALYLYHTESVIQGENKSISKVKLGVPCCYTMAVMKDEKVCGMVLLFQTGAIEIRSFPNLELVKEASLMSILRWNYKTNMDRTMSSINNGHITLANGGEVAILSLLASENDFRIPESLPCLHDKVLAAAAEAALNLSSNQKKKQGIGPGVLSGIVKGFKGGKVNQAMDLTGSSVSDFSHLKDTFSKNPFPDPSPITAENPDAIELNIDDIEIDEPSTIASASSHTLQSNDGEKGSERERLFDGNGADTKPRLRTREEIIATYRKAGDASSIAGQARNKLLERQEKLERISKRTEELQSGAEDFASLANELVKVMEGRKWWQI